MFFQKALEGNNEWWRYLSVAGVIIFSQLVGMMVFGFFLNWQAELAGISEAVYDQAFENQDFSAFGVNKNLMLFFMLLVFVITFGFFLVAINRIHERPLISYITPKEGFNWKKIGFGAIFWLGIGLFFSILQYFLTPESVEFRFNGVQFLILVLISLILLPIQTSTEELVFRGWLLQGFGLVFNRRWLALLMVSLSFALIHINNPENFEYGVGKMFFFYMTAALLLGIMTVMDDSLELALGAHFGINFTSAVLMNYKGSVLQTDSLFIVQNLQPLESTIFLIVIGAGFLYLCSRLYKWPSLSYLFQEIEFEKENEKENEYA